MKMAIAAAPPINDTNCNQSKSTYCSSMETSNEEKVKLIKVVFSFKEIFESLRGTELTHASYPVLIVPFLY